jgi:hypothetical protein
MQTGYISFCDKTAFNIKSDKVKKKILQNINNISNIKIIQKHFDVLNDNHFKKLNEIPHLVSLKTNGNPYLLFLTKHNFNNLSIFIDKKIQPGYFLPRMIITYLQFDDSLFDNTLLEGEMIKDKDNNWIFIINDIYIYKNKLLIKNNILNRLELIDKILINNFNNNSDICTFQIKKYFKYPELKYVIENFSKNLNYTSRGIYFTPLYFKFKTILYNFDDTLINTVKKVKYQNNDEFMLMKNNKKTNNISTNNNNTICDKKNTHPKKSINNSNILTNDSTIYYIEKTDMPDVFNLFTFNKQMNLYEKVDIAYIPNIKTSKFMRELFKDQNIITKLKMKCFAINKNNKTRWVPTELVK